MAKTTAAKRLAAEKNISVQEAERQLDTKLFMEKIPKWGSFAKRCSNMLRWSN